METEFLKPAEVADLLGVGRGRVYQLIRAGVIPATRVGGAIRIPREAWGEWVRRKRDEAIAELRSEGIKS